MVWDGGSNHQGPTVRAFPARNRRFRSGRTAYSPDLDPGEAAWSWPKYARFANFVPGDVHHLGDWVTEHLIGLKFDSG